MIDYCRLLSEKIFAVYKLIIDTMLSVWFYLVTQSSKHAVGLQLSTKYYTNKNKYQGRYLMLKDGGDQEAVDNAGIGGHVGWDEHSTLTR